jgi:peptidoglycan/xylan/chitin deacetylase (PgdA/CDA1 family)
VRTALKRSLELGLLRGGPASLSRLRVRGRGLILAYHNVVDVRDAGVGDSSLHMPLGNFRAQLAALEELAQVVPLRALLDSLSDSRAGADRPLVAITFDDAYLGAVRLGLPEVVRREMHATMFVSPGRLGDQGFWWDLYASQATRRGEEGFRDTALADLGGVDEKVSKWAAAKGLSEARLPPALRTADEEALSEAAQLPGVYLGSHSWSHANLTKLGDAALSEELVRSREWLGAHFAQSSPYLAYPYGIADERVAAATADAGYEAALRVAGGWLPRNRPPDTFMLPRLNVPAGISDAGFRCRLAGLLCRG